MAQVVRSCISEASLDLNEGLFSAQLDAHDVYLSSGRSFEMGLQLELQHFEDGELEQMQAGLAWLLNQITQSAKLKAKVRELPVPPKADNHSNKERYPSANDPFRQDATQAESMLTAEDQAAVEVMYRVEGLVDLLRKQLPKRELLDASVYKPSKSDQDCKCSRKVTRVAPARRRKGNKIAEKVADEQAPVAGEPEDTPDQNGGQTQPPSGTANTSTERGGEKMDRDGPPRSSGGAEDPTRKGEISRGVGDSANGEGNDGDKNEDDKDDQKEGSAGIDTSVSDQLADIQATLAQMRRHNHIAHGVLVYLVISTTIPAFTLIRWKMRQLRFMNPIKRFQKDVEKNFFGVSDDTMVDEVLPWKSSDGKETQVSDPLTQQFHQIQEALGGESEEEAQIHVEKDLRAARALSRKHWWQIGPFKPRHDPELVRTRADKRLAPFRGLLDLFGFAEKEVSRAREMTSPVPFF